VHLPYRGTPLDRSRTATLARAGGRLAAALLPLAALVVLHVIPSGQDGVSPPWLATAIFATAALATGLALTLAVMAFVSAGRIRDLDDAIGLGMLTTAFAVVALGAAAGLGIAIGVASAGVAFAAGSAAGTRSTETTGGRVTGIIVAFILVDACLAATLFGDGLAANVQISLILLAGAAILLGIAALIGIDEPMRAMALGIAATSALVGAIAGPNGSDLIIAAAGMAVAAGVMGWFLVVHRPARNPAILLPAAVVPGSEPEFAEGARLSRELRGTLNDLAVARQTIELQRAEIERATTIDPLTGLPGRTETLDRLRVETAEARRYAHPVTVLLLDVDHFAQLNHEYGLPVGDAILREVALRLRLRMREADALGRIGGDLFLAILPHTDESGAASFAHALLDRLIAGRFPTERGEMAVSVSIGIALMRPGMTLTDEELLTAAEEALASAKAAGGNRIAFDRLHGLARLDERRRRVQSAPDEPAADEADATR
jgi:diguanylate cyclase (GGDEF)-like protein